ncbi:MAG TPA: YbhB/YbcL family Raf kinase inhibitor-like protein [Galbitalea sp.]|nr:YbhB/YbcL family Raf kinase inhibitor-like protein [Galbitalea sp.]
MNSPNDPNWRLPEVPVFLLSSPDFAPGGRLPLSARSGIGQAGGEDRSPTLNWEGAPASTRSYAVTVYDPDAPTGSGFWHWAVYDIPSSVTSLAADAGNPDAGLLPKGAITVGNELGLERFFGAAPPSGHGEHRYFFTVTALDVPHLEIDTGSTPAVLGFNFLAHIVGRAQLVGTSETP